MITAALTSAQSVYDRRLAHRVAALALIAAAPGCRQWPRKVTNRGCLSVSGAAVGRPVVAARRQRSRSSLGPKEHRLGSGQSTTALLWSAGAARRATALAADCRPWSREYEMLFEGLCMELRATTLDAAPSAKKKAAKRGPESREETPTWAATEQARRGTGTGKAGGIIRLRHSWCSASSLARCGFWQRRASPSKFPGSN